MTDIHLAIFRGKQIRRAIHHNEWWFSVVDIVKALTGTDRPRKYWNDLKTNIVKEGYVEVSAKIGQLKLQAPDGKMRETDCANAETLFRIIQSIPSPKAEPFKRWLARVGYERIQEIEDPELATKRTRALYKKFKGLTRENLRDHMDDLELIFSMLGEASTTRITRAKNARGFARNKQAAREGGAIAGNARHQLEQKSGQKVSTAQNYLKTPQNKKLLKK